MSTAKFVRSYKHGFETDRGFTVVLVRDKIVYLRIVREASKRSLWNILTATAGEDDLSFNPCPDQSRLIEAGIRLAEKIQTDHPQISDSPFPFELTDSSNRLFIAIGTMEIKDDTPENEIDKALAYLEENFFNIYDNLGANTTPMEERGDLASYYSDLSETDFGQGVYLSDGVWLQSDGTVRDLGR